jgi:general secretion pathway protein A
MYTEYFQLSEEPFSIAANPRFLYLSEQHREALAHLHYGIRNDAGFVMLTGEVGTGKTTVCRCLIEQLPEQSNVALILNPRVSVEELLSSICDEFHIAHPQTGATVKTLVDAINRYLLDQNARGRNSVIIVDEAQNLSFEVLEQLRLLTNLETNERKLLRIMLIGQPELETLLARPDLRQLEQRITARFCLKPLARSELQPYVAHRLALAGCRETVFPPRVIDRLYAETGGVPRLINIICDRAMLGAYVKSQRKIDRRTLDEAAREVRSRSAPRRRSGASLGAAALLLLALGTGVFYLHEAGLVTLPRGDTADAALEAAVSPELPPSASETQVAMLGAASVGIDAVDAPPGWPAGISAENNTVTTAQAALFRLWGLAPPQDGADACAEAIDAGLRCYAGSGNLGSVERHNRPAILIMVDSSGRTYRATLRSIDENTATLEFAHGVETVTRTDLEKHWRGRFEMLWRTTPEGRAVLRPGDRGAEVTWLTRGLEAAGIDSATVTDSYDAGVTEAVRAFQRSRGLLADGIVGRQTLIHLNTVVEQAVPRLDAQGAG